MRKWIDLLNELSVSDFGGDGGGHSQTVLVYDITWDTDGEDVDLPSEATLDIDGENDEEIRDQIADKLSDQTGWCVGSFDFRFI
jgi:hypothetical protein